jgi:hypothetical protein
MTEAPWPVKDGHGASFRRPAHLDLRPAQHDGGAEGRVAALHAHPLGAALERSHPPAPAHPQLRAAARDGASIHACGGQRSHTLGRGGAARVWMDGWMDGRAAARRRRSTPFGRDPFRIRNDGAVGAARDALQHVLLHLAHQRDAHLLQLVRHKLRHLSRAHQCACGLGRVRVRVCACVCLGRAGGKPVGCGDARRSEAAARRPGQRRIVAADAPSPPSMMCGG